MSYFGLKRTPFFSFFEKIKNKKFFFPGRFVPSRTVHKVPPGHSVPSRTMHKVPLGHFRAFPVMVRHVRSCPVIAVHVRSFLGVSGHFRAFPVISGHSGHFQWYYAYLEQIFRTAAPIYNIGTVSLGLWLSRPKSFEQLRRLFIYSTTRIAIPVLLVHSLSMPKS
jgi:hypothetical protein